MDQSVGQILATANASGQRFNPSLIASYQKLGGTLSNGAIPIAGDSADNSAKVANQGKPGFDVFGNSVPGTPRPEGGSITPTTISGDKSATISNNTNTINDINASVANNKAAQFTGGLEQYSDGTPINAPTDAVQQHDENGNTWWSSGGKNYAVGPDNGLSPEDQQNQDTLTKLKAQTDAAFAGQISAVQAQYQSLIEQQKKVNEALSAGTDTALLMGGSSRYAPISSAGTSAAQVSFGIQQIADLTQKENSAIAAINVAQASKDYDIADKQMSILNKIKSDKQAAMEKLNDALIQANKDARAKLYTEVTKPIQDIATKAAENGADPKTIAAINAATNVPDAIKAAGGSLQTATGQLGDYLQYKKDAEASGLTPQSYNTWKTADDAKTSKQKSKDAYNTAYASAMGKAAGDASSGASDKVQQGLEKDFKNTLLKEFSTRSGTYGLNDAKVSQGNKLAVLFNQAYDPKTGNYNIAKSQYGELAVGLANLISGGTGASDTQIADLKQDTAKGDWNKIYTYITGQPSNASSQDVFRLLASSVDREVNQALIDRGIDEKKLIGLAPTDLDPKRRDALIKEQSIPFVGIKGVAKTNVDDYVKNNPEKAEDIAKMYEVPGATDEAIWQYLQTQNQ